MNVCDSESSAAQLVFVFGTRPDAIKIGPVVAALRERGHAPLLVCTGQHTDLLRGTPAETDLLGAESLGLRSNGNVLRWLGHAENRLDLRFQELKGDNVLVVQGDTMSAIAAARAAKLHDIPLAHIEAGVRSHDLNNPWPEEGFRREITQLAFWHYAATSTAYANLLSEGIVQQAIRLTGNPVVSALHRYADVRPRAPEATILFTMHRREWLEGPDVQDVFAGVQRAAELHQLVKFVWPVHPAVQSHFKSAYVDALPPNVLVRRPLAYKEAVGVLASALGVATDSGGLCEEAATLGVPCAVLRRVTDRPEAIEAGVAQLFAPTGAGVVEAVDALCAGRMSRRPSDLYGDLGSAGRIADHLAWLANTARLN